MAARVVCFCDIPVEDLHIHVRKYSNFGLSYLKAYLVDKGASPVFYVAKNSVVRPLPATLEGYDEVFRRLDAREEPLEATTRCAYFDRMAVELNDHFRPAGAGVLPSALHNFLTFNVMSFVKVFDDQLPDDDPKNYYMEREWRMLGNLEFELNDVHRVVLPQVYARRFREDVPAFVGQVTFA